MADLQRPSLVERDIDQAITALKKGAHLLKYGRRGKPKFCPFRLSTDETALIWCYGKDERQLELRRVSRIVPGQRTSIFQRYPRPEKEYQSFSLIYDDRSLDLICKDKDEAEVWFAGLKALIGRGGYRRRRNDWRSEALPESPRGRRITPSNTAVSSSTLIIFSHNPRIHALFSTPDIFIDLIQFTQDEGSTTMTASQSRLGKSFADVLSYTAADKNPQLTEQSNGPTMRTSGADTIRVSLSSIVSSVVLDVQRIACGQRHAILVTRQGDVFSWGEEDGGRLGHGVESDVSQPRLVQALEGKPVEFIACGQRHTCAVTLSGDLYMWGDGSTPDGPGHWLPKQVGGPLEGLQVSSVACGPWHTAVVTSAGRLFTFGDGTFGALGHGDRCGVCSPREVEGLKGLRTVRAACGVWHTAAVVDGDRGQLFTWGDGDRGQLGHTNGDPRLIPEMVSSLADMDFCRVACGNSLTLALTTSGRVYAMGSMCGGKHPICIRDNIGESFVEDIACGSHHMAVLTSKSEVYTWGKGSSGQLGHGDVQDRNIPTLVVSLKDKQVKSIACGSNFTAVICLQRCISSADNSVCSGCRSPFNFIRKRHNCYNCGLVFCKGCSARKSVKASLAPTASKPYRVCDDCFMKLAERGPAASRVSSVNVQRLSSVKLDRNLGLSVKRPSTSSKSPTSPLGLSQNFLTFFMPDPKIVSRSPSPVPGKTPQRSSTPSPPMSQSNTEDSSTDVLSFELKSLRAQVENLTSKSQLLETELESKRKQLKEMAARAADKAEKAKAAKQVIKSLTAQLKEMSEKVAEEQATAFSHSEPDVEMMNDPNRPSNGSSVTSITSPKTKNSDHTNAQMMQNGTKSQTQKSKRIVQDEPGVYITLVSLPNGANELRRVRFSRKCFKEEEAEKWWAENGTRVCEQHNVTTVR
ncbi:Regulator of chromosome condensation (RCC1) family with FYVE zinc finger domain [Striga hermonthica]|uniref:Regulator of chromosome condensation (RCC1) family with FYVE zinc finger domain n=1 Tax=Striga hermonthica TaxID=68872 RepID=A0A9N7R9X6_STRHE|nr:Regulator of chromosome condensation (RCC1) family with FYVE zinc finger domain [Striga hermonthica]